MKSVTVNISFQDTLLDDIDQMAQKESRSRSELLREAARAYIDRNKRWDRIFAFGKQVAMEHGVQPEDVALEIADHRKTKAAQR